MLGASFLASLTGVNISVNVPVVIWTITYHSESVLAAIESWPVALRARYARLTERVQVYGPDLGMPHTRSMGDGLFEIRVKGAEGIGRAFYCTVVGKKIVVLHAFIKKDQKTPRRHIDTARKRLAEVKK